MAGSEHTPELFRAFLAWGEFFLRWLDRQVDAVASDIRVPAGVEEDIALQQLKVAGPTFTKRNREWGVWLDYCIKELAAWRLIERHRAGDIYAFARLTEIFSDKVHGIAAAYARDFLEREAIVWATWMKISAALPGCHAEKGFFTNFLGVVAKNTAKDAAHARGPFVGPDDDDPPAPDSAHKPPARARRRRRQTNLSADGMEDLLWLNFSEIQRDDQSEGRVQWAGLGDSSKITDALVYAYRVWLEYDIDRILDLGSKPLRALAERLIREYGQRSGRVQSGKLWAARAREVVAGDIGLVTLGMSIGLEVDVSGCVERCAERLPWKIYDAEEALLGVAFDDGMPLPDRTAFGYLRFLAQVPVIFSRDFADRGIHDLARSFYDGYRNRSLLKPRRLRSALAGYLGSAAGCTRSLRSCQGNRGIERDVLDWCDAVQEHIDKSYSGPQAVVWDLVSA